jgi:hypothetical protein
VFTATLSLNDNTQIGELQCNTLVAKPLYIWLGLKMGYNEQAMHIEAHLGNLEKVLIC